MGKQIEDFKCLEYSVVPKNLKVSQTTSLNHNPNNKLTLQSQQLFVKCFVKFENWAEGKLQPRCRDFFVTIAAQMLGTNQLLTFNHHYFILSKRERRNAFCLTEKGNSVRIVFCTVLGL